MIRRARAVQPDVRAAGTTAVRRADRAPLAWFRVTRRRGPQYVVTGCAGARRAAEATDDNGCRAMLPRPAPPGRPTYFGAIVQNMRRPCC